MLTKVTEISYQKRQVDWVKDNDIKVGDTVRVSSACKEKGWEICSSSLKEYVGKIAKIHEIYGGGISLKLGNFVFPYTMLTRIKKINFISYEKRQEEWVKDNDIKKGDKVKVSYACVENGWEHLLPEMNKYIGKEFRVKRVSISGIILDGDSGMHMYPYSMLVKVSMTYRERQDDWVKDNDIKIGDLVKILRKAGTREDGWKNSWIPSMNSRVGEIGVVKGFGCLGEGIRIEVFNDKSSICDYPFFVLEKVTEVPIPKGVIIRKNTGDVVVVHSYCYNILSDRIQVMRTRDGWFTVMNWQDGDKIAYWPEGLTPIHEFFKGKFVGARL